MQNSPMGKISQKKQNLCDTSVENTPKKTIVEPKNAVHGYAYHYNSLGKDKSYINIMQTNPKNSKI